MAASTRKARRSELEALSRGRHRPRALDHRYPQAGSTGRRKGRCDDEGDQEDEDQARADGRHRAEPVAARRVARRPSRRGKRAACSTFRPSEDRAELLRKDLLDGRGPRSPVSTSRTRPATKLARVHCLRDTGLTHMAVRGDSPVVIQWAGGHTDFKTTQGYIARGQVEARRIGEPLPAPFRKRCSTDPQQGLDPGLAGQPGVARVLRH